MGIDEKALGIGMNPLDINGVSFFLLTPPLFLDIEIPLIVFHQVALLLSLFTSKRKKYTVKTFLACAWLPQNNLYAEISIRGAARQKWIRRHGRLC